MSKFSEPPRARNYLARREQWRLLLLVLGLGVVVLLMIEARKPANWQWFVALTAQADRAPTGAAAAVPDNRLRPPPEPDVPGTFVSPAPRKARPSKEGRHVLGVSPEWFETVEDDTIFRPDEQEAWFGLLAILQETDEASLRDEAIGRVTFAQLFSQPSDYRGQLVTLHGSVRRAHWLRAYKNDYAIKGYYQIWLQPEDNPTVPIVVPSLYLPKGFPVGMHLDEAVHVTGFFFKRWAYGAQDTVRTTPLVLARTVDWQQPAVVVKPPVIDLRFLSIVFGVAIFMAVAVTVFVYVRTTSGGRSQPGSP